MVTRRVVAVMLLAAAAWFAQPFAKLELQARRTRWGS